MRSKVSVVIPTYKRSEYLKRAVESVLNQSFENIEIVIVDDNPPESKDRENVKRIIEPYIKTGKINLVFQPCNSGGSEARNAGIKIATGEYVTFLDDDDVYLPEKIQKQYDKYSSSFGDKDGIVTCAFRIVDKSGNYLSKSSNTKFSGSALNAHLVMSLAQTSTIFTKKHILIEVNGFEDKICGQEYDLILRLLLRGYDLVPVDEVLVQLYSHENERITTNKNRIDGLVSMYNIRKQYFHLLNKKERNKVELLYHLVLFREHVFGGNRVNALKEWLIVFHNNPLLARTYIELSLLVLPVSWYDKMKSFLHKILDR